MAEQGVGGVRGMLKNPPPFPDDSRGGAVRKLKDDASSRGASSGGSVGVPALTGTEIGILNEKTSGKSLRIGG